jgi:hypothetical protein
MTAEEFEQVNVVLRRFGLRPLKPSTLGDRRAMRIEAAKRAAAADGITIHRGNIGKVIGIR